jgi:ABC-2 type transport system ATP-binding protein
MTDSGSQGAYERTNGTTRTETRESSPVTPAAIAVDGLVKRFGGGDGQVTAVDGVTLTVESGSVVGLLGPNGAGKTTLIKCILGMVLPDAGTVRLRDVDVHANPRAAAAHVDAMLEGARNDYWRLTVRENLRYFAAIGGVDPRSVAARHDRLLEQLDLAAKADEPVRNLSRGMKQKVSLASVLATESDVVFLDEPTLGLDVESSLTLRRELRRIVDERDLTVVLSSHDMDVIEDVCDRVIVLSEGRVVADETVSNLLDGSGARTYRITTPDLDEATLAGLEERFGVTAIDRGDGRTDVKATVDSDGFYALIGYLDARDVTLGAVDTVSGDLESVFVELTSGGRR